MRVLRFGLTFVWALLLALALVDATALAQSREPTEADVRAVANDLQCPVCAGQSVADSQSQLAQNMRALIRKKLADGESKEQILAYFLDRYGDVILRDPPKNGFNQTLWWLPAIGLVEGGALLGYFLYRWRTRPERVVPAGPAPTAEDLALYESLLASEIGDGERQVKDEELVEARC